MSKKTGVRFTKRNIYQAKSGRWRFRKMINGQRIFRTLDCTDERTKSRSLPEGVITEAENIYALALGGREEELKETRMRKGKVATMGEIIAAFLAWPLTKTLAAKSRRAYVSQLYAIIAEIHCPEFANITGSRASADGNGNSLMDRRNRKINSMSSNILTSDLINTWIAKRLDRGPVYASHEIRPEKDTKDLTKKELRRTLISIRTCVCRARSIFSPDGRSTGELMCKKHGAYKDLKMPDTLDEFRGKKTPKPGKNKYKVPGKVEILDLIKGLPELYKSHPEAYKAFKIAYGTGLRLGEINKLKWSDIGDEDDGYLLTLEETKNGDERTNEFLGERLFEELYAMKSDKVFVIGGDSNYRRYQLGKDVSAYFRSKDWTRNKCLHELRKYFGCLLARETGDLIAVMHALGHQDATTTRDYYHDKIGKTPNPDFTSGLPAPGLSVAA
mgnify:CR=1 FL=1